MIRRASTEESCFQFLHGATAFSASHISILKTRATRIHVSFRFVSSLIEFIIKLWAQQKYIINEMRQRALSAFCLVPHATCFFLLVHTVRCYIEVWPMCTPQDAARASEPVSELTNGLALRRSVCSTRTTFDFD